MPPSRPATWHVALIEVDVTKLDTFTQWFDGVHLPDVLQTDSWHRVRRFVCDTEANLHLAIYEACVEVSPRQPAPAAFRSPVGRRWIRSYLADTFDEVSWHGELSDDPVHLNAIFVQVAPEGGDEFDVWYDQVHVPEIVKCPGWLGARRFHSSLDPQRFLAMYDLTDPVTPFNTPEYDSAVGWDDLEHHLLAYHGFRTYSLAASRAAPSVL